MRRLSLALWGLLSIAAAVWAWPMAADAYARDTAASGVLAAIVWQACALDVVFGLAYLARAARPRPTSRNPTYGA